MILSERRRRKWLAGTLLATFAVRALIPPGFMPASDRPFSLEVCWEGLAPGTLAQSDPSREHSRDMGSMDMGSMDMDSASPAPARHHSGSPSHSEHCVFGTACSAGPISYLPPPREISPAEQLRAIACDSIASTVRLVHLPQARAPPGRLS